MSSIVEYALLAGAAYFDTRSAINRFPLPMDWSVFSRFPEDKVTGFEASAYESSKRQRGPKRQRGQRHLVF